MTPASAEPGLRFEAAYGPITTAQLVRYAGASGDFNAIHYDHHYAVEAKLGGVIAHGMLTMAFMGRAVTDKLGEGGRVTKLSARFLAPVRPGATVTASVTVTKRREDKGRVEADCELAAYVGEQKVATGEATVAWRMQAKARPGARTPGKRPLILGLGGTPRPGSTSERALAISLKAAEADGAETAIISGRDLLLPMYNPGERANSPEAERLVDLYRRCDGLIVASPAYHGSVSGLIKNALDYAEELRGGDRVYFDGLAIGLIACAAGWQATGQTLAALRSIAHALRGWPTPLGAALNTSTRLIDETGQCVDPSSQAQLETVGRQVVRFSRMGETLNRLEREVSPF